jgi:hypothetical protein
MIQNGTVKPFKRKTEEVQCFPEPTNVWQVQAFLDLIRHFRKFISRYAMIARPLSNFLRANIKFNFGTFKDAFMRLKILLSERPVLNLYRISADTSNRVTYQRINEWSNFLTKIAKISCYIQCTLREQ